MSSSLQAVDLKEQGNALLHSGHPAQAAAKYTEAMQVAGRSAVLLSNRSVARMRCNDFTGALADAQAAVQMASDWDKAHARVVDALEALGRHRDAVSACARGLKVCPDSPLLQAKLQNLSAKTKGSPVTNESHVHPPPPHRPSAILPEKERGTLPELAGNEGDIRAQRQLQARGELLYSQISAGEDSLLQLSRQHARNMEALASLRDIKKSGGKGDEEIFMNFGDIFVAGTREKVEEQLKCEQASFTTEIEAVRQQVKAQTAALRMMEGDSTAQDFVNLRSISRDDKAMFNS